MPVRSPGVTRLILLNGAPAVGKSTLAQRYVDEHPLALNLDIDTVRSLLGGWLDEPQAAGRAARRLALEMAEAHLLDGHDVVVPQMVAVAAFIEELESVAVDVGVAFHEIVMRTEEDEAIRRFDGRRGEPSVPGRFNPSELSEEGGATVVPTQHQRLEARLVHRPHAVRIAASGSPDDVYAALMAALG